MAMTLRLTDEETEALRAVAAREDRSMQDVARDAIVRYTSGHEQRRALALARITEEYADAIARLGDS